LNILIKASFFSSDSQIFDFVGVYMFKYLKTKHMPV